MPTLLTDPRSGGVKKKSGVNVLPIIQETWARVRDDSDETTFLLATYEANSKTNITLFRQGNDLNPISKIFGSSNSDSDGDLLLPQDIPIFGGIKVPGGGGVKFASFVYMGTDVGVMARGRASMHRNGFLNVLEGCGDLTGIDVWMYMKEEHLGMDKDECETTSNNNHSCSDSTSSAAAAAIRNDAATAQEEDQEGIIEEQKSPTGESISLSSDPLLSISPATTSSSMDLTPSIPYEELKHMNISSSSTSAATFGIDPAKKEMALSDNEFQQVFSMSKDTFVTLPKWKQMKMKKEVSLF